MGPLLDGGEIWGLDNLASRFLNGESDRRAASQIIHHHGVTVLIYQLAAVWYYLAGCAAPQHSAGVFEAETTPVHVIVGRCHTKSDNDWIRAHQK